MGDVKLERDVFSYLDKDYRYLNNYIRDISDAIFTAPHSAIIKGRTFTENLTKEIFDLEKYDFGIMMTQFERLKKLEDSKVIEGEIDRAFNEIRILGNKAAHANVEGELEVALRIHRNIYKITCWFVQTYIDHDFQTEPYKSPVPNKEKASQIDMEVVTEIIKKTMENFKDNPNESSSETASNLVESKKDIDDAYTDLLVESILNDEPDKKMLGSRISKIKGII